MSENIKVGSPEPFYFCSFCGKHHDELRLLIAGPHANICSNCVALCVESMAKKIHEGQRHERA